MIILVLIEMVFIIICERFHGTIYLNSMLLVILDFVSVFKLELMYIPLYPKYQAEPHSSPWFSVAACAAAIAHRNPFFYLYQQNKSSESKVETGFNYCSRVLKTVKLAFANKTKDCITSQKLGLPDFS